jgi:hypothetical protein
LADAGDRGRADLVLAGRPDQSLHRREQVVQVEQEGDEGAHVDGARGDLGAAQAEDDDERHLDGQPGGVAGQRRSPTVSAPGSSGIGSANLSRRASAIWGRWQRGWR